MYSGSHKVVDYPTKVREKLRKLLIMEKLEIDWYACFVGHGNLQLAQDCWKGRHLRIGIINI